MALLGLMAGWSRGSESRRGVPLLALGDGIGQFVDSCRWTWCGNACNLRLAGNLLAAPNAVFFARIRCLTRLCDVYDAQTTIWNSAQHDIRRIRVPLHAELCGKAERRGLGVAGKPATFTQASEGSGKRVTINFCAACGTKLCLDSAQNGHGHTWRCQYV